MGDFDRPLNDRGRSSAQVMGHKLHSQKMFADVVLASTAARVRETLDLLLPAWKWNGPVLWEKSLYLASPETLLNHLAALDNTWHTAMIVGHNPGLSELVAQLSGNSTDLPTAAIVVLTNDQPDWTKALRTRPWHQQAYWTPKQV